MEDNVVIDLVQKISLLIFIVKERMGSNEVFLIIAFIGDYYSVFNLWKWTIIEKKEGVLQKNRTYIVDSKLYPLQYRRVVL